MRDEGYYVDLPASHAELRDAILKGNAKQLGPGKCLPARAGGRLRQS